MMRFMSGWMWCDVGPRRRPDSRPVSCGYTQIHVGAELARDGGLTADQSLAGVHIRFCGNGEGMPSLGEGPDGGQDFLVPFGWAGTPGVCQKGLAVRAKP
jgi:hypothetical protein